VSLSILTVIFPGGAEFAGTRMSLVLDFIGAKDDGGGGDNKSYKTCRAPVKMSPSANQYPVFYRLDALPCHPTNSIRALKETTAQCLYVHIVAPTAQHWYRNLELNFTAKLSILSSVGLKSHASSTT